MNQRPTRTAPPPDQAEDAHFTEAPAPERQAVAVAHAKPQMEPSQFPERETVTLPKTGFAVLAAAIAAVMEEIKPVEKSGWNDFHKYWHARMQDLSTALTPLMGKHGIVVFQNELSRDMFDEGRTVAIRYEFTIVHKSGEIWPERPVITGMSACRTSNGKFDDKTFNKCHTSARKYFLIGLFQIPTEDAEGDPDNDGGTGQRPRPTARRAPAPDGTVGPHLIPVVNGEHPSAWAERFTKAIGTARAVEDVNKWYDANFVVFDKIRKNEEFTAVYNSLIDAMDAREKALLTPAEKDDPISSGPQKRPARAATKPKPAEEAFDEEAWLTTLTNAYSGCEDTTSLIEAQAKYMTPDKANVSAEVWSKAVGITKVALKRIEDQ